MELMEKMMEERRCEGITKEEEEEKEVEKAAMELMK